MQEGRTVLHYASFTGITDLVKPLLKSCKEPRFINATDFQGDTSLHIATRKGFMDIVKLLTKTKKTNQKIKNSVSLNTLIGPFHLSNVHVIRAD